jgi:hypothetical protein
MNLTPENRKIVYDTFIIVYEAASGSKLKWRQGEKGRVKMMFTLVSEAMGIRDEEKFTKVVKMFANYMISAADKWITWDKRDRGNYIGFLLNKENINIFVKGESKLGGKKIVGVKEKNDWEF